MRYFLQIKYVGTNYHGWQVQPNAITVQQVVENKLSVLLGKKTRVTGCGRTDTGVHAEKFFLHFDAEIIDTSTFFYSLNNVLPYDISLSALFPIKQDGHARFDATSRTYEYRMHKKKDPFLFGRSLLLKKPLNVPHIITALEDIKVNTDFSCFSKTGTQVKTNICNIISCNFQESEIGYCLSITADRFLRNMVRAIAGTLIDIGLGKMESEQMKKIILSKDRSAAGCSVEACGLYLVNVTYPYI